MSKFKKEKIINDDPWALSNIATMGGALLVLVLIVCYVLFTPSKPNRFVPKYQITALVSIDGKLYTNSAIWSITCKQTIDHHLVPLTPCRLIGEAISIDLGEKGILIFTLRGLTYGTKRTPALDVNHDRLARAVVSVGGENAAPQQFPVMLSCLNPCTAQSLHMVDPEHLDDRFGKGHYSINLSVKREFELSRIKQIDTLLPWLDDYQALPIVIQTNNEPIMLSVSDFKRVY